MWTHTVQGRKPFASRLGKRLGVLRMDSMCTPQHYHKWQKWQTLRSRHQRVH